MLRSSDGDLLVIGELPFEDYLKGIAEVPRDWPMEALKAQVVAARTYAAGHLDPSGTYDLCATDACQVYTGMAVEAGPWGHRWVQAVEETEGQILRYGGRPATAVYFSTSNGRTYGNEEVFGGAPLPYLRGHPEHDDGASPLAHWSARFPFEDLARFLAADGRWSGRPIREVRVDGGRIVVRGSRKAKAVLGRGDLRDALNDWAGCLEPATYPGREGGGYRLPQPVPSEWFRAEVDDGTLVIEGRGWGHGVGMVQWGAYGKAQRGLSYDRILAAYYGGLRPQRVDLPDTVRVLLATDLASVTVVPSGEPKVGGGRQAPAPPWRLTGGRKLRIHHGPQPPAQLEARWADAPRKAFVGEPFGAGLRLSTSAHVRLRFIRGGTSRDTAWAPYHEGIADLRLTTPKLDPGGYRVRAIAWDGVETVRSAVIGVRVRSGPPPAATASPSSVSPRSPGPSAAAEERPSSLPLVVFGALAGALVAAVLTVALRRRLHRSP